MAKAEELHSIIAQGAESSACARELAGVAKDLLSSTGHGRISISGLEGSADAITTLTLARTLAHEGKPLCILAILGDHDEAAYFFGDIEAAASATEMAGSAAFFPSGLRKKGREYVSDEAELVMRTEALGRLAHGEAPLIIVSYPEALAQKVPPTTTTAERSLTVEEGGKLNVSATEEKLMDWGFKPVDYVYSPGEFAIRGSIVDIFSFSCSEPIRVDLFGDDVESIRTFDTATQLSIDRMGSVIIAPEAGAPSAGDGVSFFSLLPHDAAIVAARGLGYAAERAGIFIKVRTGGEADTAAYIDAADILRLGESKIVIESNAPRAQAKDYYRQIEFHTAPAPPFHKDFRLLSQTIIDYSGRGYRVCIAADSAKQLDRIADALRGIGEASFTPVMPALHAGFVSDDERLCLFSDHEIFDRYHRFRLKAGDGARRGKNALTMKEVSELQVGDYVVHIDHGIGRFMGLVRTGQGESKGEAIKLEYAGGDIVMVSLGSLHKLSKYRGGDATPPRVSHLGTGAWQRIKDRAKKHIKDIARDLIRLYAERRQRKGFAFAPDDYMQHELEASFAYEDTPDQAAASAAVKHDMESQRPMDRLVCGDVGFGKTEIAIRAAFKAALSGKQTAVLVPTTVLALQHYKTFCRRLEGFPVHIDYLTRARTPAQTRATLAALAAGQTDIIIGTHKLTGKSVKFHDLGLLVIDEEQKFGVAVKEKLRQIKAEVDTLTLSATPIPRTLQFSLMGARDMSVIRTAPPNRRPIETIVTEPDPSVVSEAVGYELSRGGQVFVVCRRISRLPAVGAMIERSVKGARVAICHGQMPPEDTERIILAFAEGDYDVLVSTTIVENGIDIPNANTIIIENAQDFGLSDLHQMRGRVGRADRSAYCYLIAPPLASLPDDARRRLEAVESFSDLGSGMSIALQDLDIRGAGNMLGAEQSGFIADMGFETYQRILTEAVDELKAEEFSTLPDAETSEDQAAGGDIKYAADCSVESDVAMYFPETYVPGASERIMLYRELDGISDDATLERYKQRLADRFGTPPPPAVALMQLPILRREACRMGVERIFMRGGKITLFFISDKASPFYKSATFDSVIAYAMKHIHTCRLDESGGRRKITISGIRTPEAAIKLLKEMQIRG